MTPVVTEKVKGDDNVS